MQSSVLLKTSQVITLPSEYPPTDQSLYFCNLRWKQKILLVLPNLTVSSFPAIANETWLIDCLRRSPVKKVCLDSNLGEDRILFWANACERSEKPVFLRRMSSYKYDRCQSLSWWVKRGCDWLAAAVLCLLLSPLFLGLATLISLTSPGSLFFRQWRVGKNGQLFQIIKFRSMVMGAENMHHQVMGNQSGLHKCLEDPRVGQLGRWMRRCSLDELPQLFNVLRGEMSLVGPRPWALYDALRLNTAAGKERLRALPGITGAWQVTERSNLRDLDAVSEYDLKYLAQWSLWSDLKILLLTIPKVIVGNGAY